ncbi:hypothetical protein PF004_g29736 [Phytophthora fragariae]|uniref:Uncharacterized protein n=1 Tax=Phytophthora fragariae TaxID=53985 RepID=A0A6G0MDZ5_9STRA|nr:hypothetical protein PF004_g29736 [Phytophthora fragariae]
MTLASWDGGDLRLSDLGRWFKIPLENPSMERSVRRQVQLHNYCAK